MRPSPLSAPVALLFVLLAAALAGGAELSGPVVGVSDGDTIRVLADVPVKVRLAGVDCPEKRQPYGLRAKQLTSDLAFGARVRVVFRETDRYGRTVGEVFLPGGGSLNRELVRAGLAWWYRAYSSDASLGALEAEARAARRGLWADADAVPPWEWRRARRQRGGGGANSWKPRGIHGTIAP